jgi:hypothetical protein
VTDDAGGAGSLTRAAAHVFFGVGRGIASTVYGTIVVMATLSAAYATEKDPWRLASIVGSTAIVLWIAHLYSHALSETIAHGARPNRRGMLAIARVELGILLAAATPVVALALGASGVMRETAAVWLALSIGLVTLAVEGLRFARLEHFGLTKTLIATAVNISLGLVVVLLKITVEH